MASELLQAKGKNDMGLFASKNKRIEKETEDPFTFTIPYVNNLELNPNDIEKEDNLFLKLIVSHKDVNQRNSSEQTLLHIAASRGLVHSCRLLLQRQAEVDVVDKIGQTPLIISCFNNHSKVIKLLLHYAANPNILTPTCGQTALHVLCFMFNCFRFYSRFYAYKSDSSYVDVEQLIKYTEEVEQRNVYCKPDWGCKDVELLIQHGADINIRNVYGETVLHYCCTYGTSAMVDLLINKGSDLNCRGKHGYTPLHLVIYSPPFDVPLSVINTGLNKVKILLNAGADFSIENSDGDSHYHLILNKFGMDPDVYEPILSFFLKHDPKMDRLNIWGQNCLHVFAPGDSSVQCDIVKHIVQCGISVNSTDDFGNTPIHYLWHHKDVLKSLMEVGGDINVRNNLGQTPLQKILSQFHLDKACDVMSKYKPKGDIRDNMGKSLLHYFMKFFISYVNKKNAGIILSSLLNAGCNVNTQDNTGTSCLHIHCIDILLEQPDIDVNIMDHFGSTPLHLAVWEGRADCVKKLLSASGIVLDIQDINNRTALDVAAQRCHLHISDLFLEKSKNANLGPHLRIDASSGDIHTFIGYTEIEMIPFLQECLECPDLGNIWNEEATTIRTEVDVFVKNLVKEITVRDPRFEMEVILSGSVSEETKCGLPDEFDYMMALTRFVDICNLVPDTCVNESRPGYVSLQSNETGPPEYDIYFEFMSSEILKRKITAAICSLIISILKLKLFTSCTQLLVESSPTLSGASLEIKLTWRGAYFKNLPVKIDFVPILKLPNWCPDNLNVHSSRLLSPSVIQEVGCDVTLMKFVDDIPQELSMGYELPLCRISCSRLELKVFQTINSVAKKGYILAKCMLLLKQYDPISNKMVKGKYSDIIQSYMLKTALFYILDEYTAKGEDEYSAVDICEGIYDYIFEHIVENESGEMYIKMATYFMSDVFIESEPFETHEKKLKFGLQLHSIQGTD